MKKLLIISVIMCFAASFAYAGGNTGCGLGTMIIGDQDSTLMQSFAVTTNGTSGNQTFGITSGTLGCKKPSKFAQADQVNKFVMANMDNLAVDISRGHGETISNLAILMNVKDADAFGAKLQSNFDKIYASADVEYADVVDAIYASI